MWSELWPILLTAGISGAAAGFGAYVAVRVEIAVLSQRMLRAEKDIVDNDTNIGDAHERIDTLQRSRMKTL